MKHENQTSQVSKIIWAVDPFAKDKSFQKNAAWGLRALVKDEKTVIEPVYSLGSYPSGLPFEGPKDLLEQVRLKAQDEMEELLRRVKLPGLLPIRVLPALTDTLRGRTDQLIAYAKESGACLIVASTRARKGPNRWITGSFAESLMLRSDVPLFLVNPWWDRSSDLKQILFPTDFSDESKGAFRQVLQLAKAMKGRVTIYHKIGYDLDPVVGIGLAAFPPFIPIPPETYEEEVKARKEQALRWAKEADGQGVRADTFVDARVVGSPSDAILRFSKKKPGMIAMAAHSGSLAAVMLGSTTRQVVRSSGVPVWIVHTPPKQKKREAGLRTLRARRKSAQPVSFAVTEEEVMGDLQDHGRKAREA